MSLFRLPAHWLDCLAPAVCLPPHALCCCRCGSVRACFATRLQQIREEARKQQEELERILEENKKRVEAAQAAAAAAAAAGQQQQQPAVGSGAASAAAGSGEGVGRATSAANPLLQRPSVRSGGGMILVE